MDRHTYVPSSSLSVSSMCAVAAKSSKKSGAICKSSSSTITLVTGEGRDLGKCARSNGSNWALESTLKSKLNVLSSAHLKWLLSEWYPFIACGVDVIVFGVSRFSSTQLNQIQFNQI